MSIEISKEDKSLTPRLLAEKYIIISSPSDDENDFHVVYKWSNYLDKVNNCYEIWKKSSSDEVDEFLFTYLINTDSDKTKFFNIFSTAALEIWKTNDSELSICYKLVYEKIKKEWSEQKQRLFLTEEFLKPYYQYANLLKFIWNKNVSSLENYDTLIHLILEFKNKILIINKIMYTYITNN